MSEFDDLTIHRLLLEQDPTGLDALVAQHSARVYRLAQVIVGRAGGPEDVEEATSDAFAATWYASPTPPRARLGSYPRSHRRSSRAPAAPRTG